MDKGVLPFTMRAAMTMCVAFEESIGCNLQRIDNAKDSAEDGENGWSLSWTCPWPNFPHAATCQGGQPVLLNTQDVHSSVIAPAPQCARDESLPSVSIQGMASSNFKVHSGRSVHLCVR